MDSDRASRIATRNDSASSPASLAENSRSPYRGARLACLKRGRRKPGQTLSGAFCTTSIGGELVRTLSTWTPVQSNVKVWGSGRPAAEDEPEGVRPCADSYSAPRDLVGGVHLAPHMCRSDVTFCPTAGNARLPVVATWPFRRPFPRQCEPCAFSSWRTTRCRRQGVGFFFSGEPDRSIVESRGLDSRGSGVAD